MPFTVSITERARRLPYGKMFCMAESPFITSLLLLVLQGFVYAGAVSNGGGGGSLIPDEQRLYERIMGNYVRAVKPVVGSGVPLQVLFSIRLKQIVDLDERQQVLTTNVFIDQTWIDSALAWNASEFSDVTSLRIPADQIWKPDTFIYNNADNGSTGFVNGKFIQIRHNGAVTWPVPVRLRSSCVVKIAYFPFDYQKCLVRFGSWIYSHRFMDYTIRPDAVSVDLTTYVNNSEWELLSMTMEKDTRKRARSDNIHPFLTMTIYLRRNTFFYLFNIIVPCIMLSMLTLMTFWLPPTSGEKVTLGLSVFLAFSMFMLLIADEVPASSDAVPIIGIYLCVVMTMTSVSVILAVLVTNLYHRGTKLRSPPAWLSRLFIRVLAVPMCVSRDVQLLATTIMLPDHCRFFLIHNEFDFPNCNINAYDKYNHASKCRRDLDSTHSSVDEKINEKNPSKVEGEEQRFVFDHKDPHKMWNSRDYTSGKRIDKKNDSWGGRTHDASKPSANSKHPTNATIINYDEGIESCNSDTEIDECEKSAASNKKSKDHHLHCSLQHLCASTLPPRKAISPMIDKLCLNKKDRKVYRHNTNNDRNSDKTTPQLHSEELHKHRANHNASFEEDGSEIHVVTVDITPMGAAKDKSLPFAAHTLPSSFLPNSRPYTSPNQQRRRLIETMKNYTENKDGIGGTQAVFHQSVMSCEDIFHRDIYSSSNSVHFNKKLLKLHRGSKKKSSRTIRGISQIPPSDCSLSMNDLRLHDSALQSRRFSSETLAKVSNYRKNKVVPGLSSSCTIFNTNIPFEARSSDNAIPQSSTLSQNHHPSSFHPCMPLLTQFDTEKHQTQPARLCTFPILHHNTHPEVVENKFCDCSESQEDVWVPYDKNDHSDCSPNHDNLVWCLQDDNFHNLSEYDYHSTLGIDQHSDFKDDTCSPLLRQDSDYFNFTNNALNRTPSPPTSSSRRARKQKSLTQQSVEQFLDERSKLILAKARLIMAEWQTIAAVIDRLLFLVALFATIFAYIFLLVIIPSEHNLDSFNMSNSLPTSTGRYDWLSP